MKTAISIESPSTFTLNFNFRFQYQPKIKSVHLLLLSQSIHFYRTCRHYLSNLSFELGIQGHDTINKCVSLVVVVVSNMIILQKCCYCVVSEVVPVMACRRMRIANRNIKGERNATRLRMQRTEILKKCILYWKQLVREDLFRVQIKTNFLLCKFPSALVVQHTEIF